MVLCVSMHAQYTVTFELVEQETSGCGQMTDCDVNRICYNLVATPSQNDAWVASYDIWFVINNGSGTDVVYESDATCIIIDNTDLPPSGATTFIRVGASQGNSSDIINGPTVIHNFCLEYTTLEALEVSTLQAAGSFASFNSNMSVQLPSGPANAILIPTTLTFTTGNNTCLALPVKWLSFTARKSGNTALLEWTTSDELNNAGYVIERSADGKNYAAIGNQVPSNATDQINSYSFTDKAPVDGVNYYRIRQNDVDGQYSFSNVRTLYFGDQVVSSKIWPNPARDEFVIDLGGAVINNLEVALVGVDGKPVWRGKYDEANSHVVVHLDDIEPGLYTVILESPAMKSNHKLVVVK